MRYRAIRPPRVAAHRSAGASGRCTSTAPPGGSRPSRADRTRFGRSAPAATGNRRRRPRPGTRRIRPRGRRPGAGCRGTRVRLPARRRPRRRPARRRRGPKVDALLDVGVERGPRRRRTGRGRTSRAGGCRGPAAAAARPRAAWTSRFGVVAEAGERPAAGPSGAGPRTRSGTPSRWRRPRAWRRTRRPVAALRTTPATTSPSTSAAMETAYSGRP